MTDVNWQNWAALLTIFTVLVGLAWGYARYQLGQAFATRTDQAALEGRMTLVERGFASKADHVALECRVTATETLIAKVPDAAMIHGLADRMRAVESGVEGLRADTRNNGEGIRRTERIVELLLKHQMSEDT